jgi:4-amino-4-deoxy-L-arabinose transferase-like glycosyltransferase
MRDIVVGEAALPRVRPRTAWRWLEWLGVGAVVLLAFGLRAWAVRWGLPYVDHPDEPNPVTYALRMLQTGDLNPHFFQKPSLYVYLLLPVFALHYRWGRVTGLYPPLDQLPLTTHLFTTVPGFFVWGRLVTVVVGSLTVLVVYLLGKRLWSRTAGLVAALWLAVLPFHMRHSQYVTTDVPSALWVLLTFGAAAALLDTGRWRWYLLAGLCAGLAASTKYNAGVVALPIVVAHGLHWQRQTLRQVGRLIAAGAAALVGFVLGTPYALLAWPEFWAGLVRQVDHYAGGAHGDYVGAWNVGGYVDFFWHEGLGVVGGAAVLLGVGVLLWQRRRLGLLWLSFALPYLGLLLAQPSHFMRNLMPLLVLCALPVGVAGAAAGVWLAWHRSRVRPLTVAVVLLVVLLSPLLASARYTLRLHRGDTRVAALRWIEANIPPGTQIAAELKPLPGPTISRWVEVPVLTAHDLAWYRQQGYAYVIGSSHVWRQWSIPAAYARFAGRTPLIEFGGADPFAMLGPHLVVYPTGLAATDVPEPLAGSPQIGGTRLLGVTLGDPSADMPQLGVQPGRVFKAGAVLGLRTFWQVEQPFAADMFIFVHVLDAAGTTVAQRDAPPWQGRFPTSVWRSGTIVVDINDVALPPNLPPGSYTVVIGMFDPITGTHPPLLVHGQPQTGSAVPLGSITIKE